MKKLYFFDVDGTLIEFRKGIYEISDNLKRALKIIKDRGDKYFICTGRAHGTLPDNIREIGASGYSLCAGAFVTMDGKVIRNAHFNSDELNFMMKRFNQFETFILLEAGFDLLTNRYNDESVLEQLKVWGINKDYLKPIENLDNLKVNKISITFKNAEDARCLEDFSDRGITVLPQPTDNSFDITLASSTKEDGVKAVREYFSDFEKVKIYAFGDSYNDLEMIRYADMGIAMGNAVEDLKKEADYVTSSVDEDGIYNALKNLGEI